MVQNNFDNTKLKRCKNIAMFYRRIQMFVILCNQCFQTCMWPAIQCLGAMLIISMLSVLLLFQSRIPIIAIVCISLLTVAIMLVCCIMLDLGSRPILISGKILQKTKRLNGCKWSQKFFKSCPSIALRIGHFHKMDRARIPAFIRFILQRTFFLVLRTKLSEGFKNL